jgi:hypothetical protein
MKCRTILSIALAMSIIFVSLISSDSTVNAQQGGGGIFNTGIITLGPNQVLRLTVATGDFNGNNNIIVRFRQMGYMEQNNIYKSTYQFTGNPIQLAPGEGASIDISQVEFNAVSGIVQVNTGTSSRKPTVIAQIIDAPTGNVQGIIGILIE